MNTNDDLDKLMAEVRQRNADCLARVAEEEKSGAVQLKVCAYCDDEELKPTRVVDGLWLCVDCRSQRAGEIADAEDQAEEAREINRLFGGADDCERYD